MDCFYSISRRDLLFNVLYNCKVPLNRNTNVLRMLAMFFRIVDRGYYLVLFKKRVKISFSSLFCRICYDDFAWLVEFTGNANAWFLLRSDD